MKKHIYQLILLLCFTGLLFSGCMDENLTDGKGNIEDGDEIEVTFQYKVPGFSTDITSRSTIADHEARISRVCALVYEVDDYGVERFAYYRLMMDNSLEETWGNGTFKMRLAKSRTHEKYTFDFFFNGGQIVENILGDTDPKIKQGTTRQQVQQLIRNNSSTFLVGVVGPSTTLPKWAGITTGMEITAYTDFPVLNIFQCLARIDAGVNLDENDEAQGLDNFTLNQLVLYGTATSALYFPDVNNIQGDKVIAPSVVADGYGIFTQNSTKPINNNKLISEYYLFEQDVNFTSMGRAFTIVIRGSYTTPEGVVMTNQYYPVRFVDPGDPDKKLHILRNCIYRINIRGVSGPGYSSVALALAGESTNLKCDLYVQENGNINHVVYNNQNYLGVSGVSLEYDGTAATRQMKVKTDVPGGWSLKVTDDQGNIPGWISCSPSSSPTSGNLETVGLTLQAHSAAPRSAILTFTAGPLSIQTRIIQNGAWFIYTDYQPGVLINGDGSSYEVGVHGNVPANLKVRVFGPLRNLAISDGLTYTGGVIPAGSPHVQSIDVFGNAWIPMAIRDVQFQYSIDNGTTWVTFQEGRQGKGHYRLKSSGRLVSLYDYTGGSSDPVFTWTEAMGIKPEWETTHWYYQSYYIDPIPMNNPPVGLVSGNNRNTLFYTPDPDYLTGCADYWEKGYEEKYPRGKWRLPAVTELVEMQQYYEHIGDLALYGTGYWSSTDQNVTGGSWPGSYLVHINPGEVGWWIIQVRSYKAHVRCVYDDPDREVLKEKYESSWYYNPNSSLPSEGKIPGGKEN